MAILVPGLCCNFCFPFSIWSSVSGAQYHRYLSPWNFFKMPSCGVPSQGPSVPFPSEWMLLQCCCFFTLNREDRAPMNPWYGIDWDLSPNWGKIPFSYAEETSCWNTFLQDPFVFALLSQYGEEGWWKRVPHCANFLTCVISFDSLTTGSSGRSKNLFCIPLFCA